MKLLFCIVILILLIFSCSKPENCPTYFILPINVYPKQIQYKVGDTISITSKFHSEILAYDQLYNALHTIDMKGIYWHPLGKVGRIDSIINENVLYSVLSDHFIYLKDTLCAFELFQYSEDGTGLVGEYGLIQDTFYLAYKLICLKPGTFIMGHGGKNLQDDTFQQEFPGKCKGEGLEVRYKMNEGSDNNIHLLMDSPHSHWNTWILDDPDFRFHRSGGYCFTVVP